MVLRRLECCEMFQNISVNCSKKVGSLGLPTYLVGMRADLVILIYTRLRHEVAPDVEHVARVQRVEQRDAEAEQHLRDAQNDGQFHLVAVSKCELILGAMPARVDTEGVNRPLLAQLARPAVRVGAPAAFVDPHRAKKVRHEPKNVVVD